MWASGEDKPLETPEISVDTNKRFVDLEREPIFILAQEVRIGTDDIMISLSLDGLWQTCYQH